LKIEKKFLLYILLIPIVGIISGISIGLYLIQYSHKITQKNGEYILKDIEISMEKKHLKILVDAITNNIYILHKYNKNNFLDDIKHLYDKNKNHILIYKLNHKQYPTIIYSNKPIVGSDIKILTNMIKKEGFLYYYSPRSKQLQQIFYTKYYQPLHIIIVGKIYLKQANKFIEKYKNDINLLNNEVTKNFILITFVMFIITLLFAIFIANSLITEFEKFRRKISLKEKKLRYKLYLDELTNLKSRKALIEDIEKHRFDCLVLIDIDNFSNINQYFGAEIGDKYLQKFAILLKKFRKNIKNSVTLYRIGSDEFTIAIKKANYEETNKIVHDLYKFLNQQKIYINDEKFDIDVTIVFTDFPEPLKKALLTMTEAKSSHLYILSYNDIKNKNKQKEFFEIKKILNTAIEKDQIVPYAQPIVNEQKEIIKYELLMRIETDTNTLPPYLLEYAKKTKIYTKISSIMMEKAFKFIKECDILCSINIDMLDILTPKVVHILKENVKKLNKPVVFEILESESFTNYNEVKNFINEFRKYGVLFAIDDFGSGYSNYSEILEIKPDYLKIDGSLIRNINNSKDNLILIESILFLTNMIGIKTTAEFIEDEKTFKKLRAIGIDEFQGYYFGKPKPIEEIIKNKTK